MRMLRGQQGSDPAIFTLLNQPCQPWGRRGKPGKALERPLLDPAQALGVLCPFWAAQTGGMAGAGKYSLLENGVGGSREPQEQTGRVQPRLPARLGWLLHSVTFKPWNLGWK